MIAGLKNFEALRPVISIQAVIAFRVGHCRGYLLSISLRTQVICFTTEHIAILERQSSWIGGSELGKTRRSTDFQAPKLGNVWPVCPQLS